MKQFSYIAFGLKIGSDIELTELKQSFCAKYDVLISVGDIDQIKHNIVRDRTVFFKSNKNQTIFGTRKTGYFDICHGKNIMIYLDNDSSIVASRHAIYSNVFAIILHQRKTLLIHGSSIMHNNKAIVFSGESSVGKSTLVAKFDLMGYRVLNDDISAISKDKSGRYFVHPGFPFIKLNNDVIDSLDLKNPGTHFQPLVNKNIVPLMNFSAEGSYELKAIVLLAVKGIKRVEVSEISGLEMIRSLTINTYRSQLIREYQRIEEHFHEIIDLVKTIVRFKVDRPTNDFLIVDLISTIEDEVLINVN